MPALIAAHRARGRQDLPNARRRGARGGRFPALLRRADARRFPACARPLGPVACISPWNFPLAIFTGQVAAALAAGNAVLAKPAEETPLIAAQAVRVPPRGRRAARGAAAAARRRATSARGWSRDARVRGVMFTGSTEVARLIHRSSPSGSSRRPADSADRGDRRTERDDRRFLGAARAGGGRRDHVRLRQRRPALLGAARALPAGGGGRPRSARC